MFEERLRLLEGAEACFAHRHRAWRRSSSRWPRLLRRRATGSCRRRGLFGSCFVILDEILPRWGVETVFVDGPDLDQWRAALSEPTHGGVLRDAVATRCRSSSTSRPSRELAHAAGAQVVVDNVFAHAGACSGRWSSAPTSSSTRPPSTSTARAARSAARSSGPRSSSTRPVQNLMRHTGPSLSPVQRLGADQGPGDAGAAGRAAGASALRHRRAGSRRTARCTRFVYPFLDSHPQHDLAKAADARRRHGGDLRARRRQGRGLPAAGRAADRRHLQQPRRLQVAGHPPGDDDAPPARRRRRGWRSASPTASCGSRSGSRTPTTSSRTSTRRSPRSGARASGGQGQARPWS